MCYLCSSSFSAASTTTTVSFVMPHNTRGMRRHLVERLYLLLLHWRRSPQRGGRKTLAGRTRITTRGTSRGSSMAESRRPSDPVCDFPFSHHILLGGSRINHNWGKLLAQRYAVFGKTAAIHCLTRGKKDRGRITRGRGREEQKSKRRRLRSEKNLLGEKY